MHLPTALSVSGNIKPSETDPPCKDQHLEHLHPAGSDVTLQRLVTPILCNSFVLTLMMIVIGKAILFNQLHTWMYLA